MFGGLNHRDVIAAADFFTVPTAAVRVLHVFFVLHHDRRRVLHFNVSPRTPDADTLDAHANVHARRSTRSGNTTDSAR